MTGPRMWSEAELEALVRRVVLNDFGGDSGKNPPAPEDDRWGYEKNWGKPPKRPPPDPPPPQPEVAFKKP